MSSSRNCLSVQFPAILLLIVIAFALPGSRCFAQSSSFGQQVRPILSDHCFACHGPDEEARSADLRLDTADGISYVVIPGDEENSELVARVSSDDPDMVMPPPDFSKPLSDAQIATFRRWVADGAEYQEHWSFIAPKKESPDGVTLRNATQAIDYCINQELDRVNLSPNGPADDRTLLRRVCLDLTGLPPTREQIDAFVEDRSANAYKTLVESLLESPRYGEHLGRYWLDLVRYGDTHGLHLDNYREMWPYRDWVIGAVNQNMPFDQFITEQLAGDLLPDATQDQQIASGFNRLNVTTNEGGSIYEEVFSRNVIDRTDAFGTVFLGLTTGCSVCHDHKFDPITTHDYYSLSAYFNSIDGRAMDKNIKDHAPSIKVPTKEQSAAVADCETQLAELRTEMAGPIDTVDAAQSEWEQSVQKSTGDHHELVLSPTTVTSKKGVEMVINDDQSVSVIGEVAGTDTVTIVASLQPNTAWQTLHLEALTETPDSRVGLSDNGNVVLTEIEVEKKAGAGKSNWTTVPIRTATADIEQPGDEFGIRFAIDGSDDRDKGWAVDGHNAVGPRNAWLVLTSLATESEEALIRVRLKYKSRYAKHQFRQVRLSLSTAMPDVPNKVVELVSVPVDERSNEQNAEIRKIYRSDYCTHADWTVLVHMEKGLVKTMASIRDSITSTLVWKELGEPRQAYVLNRGQYDAPGDPVQRRTPSFLPPMDDGLPNDRLGLARWLTSESHPLTSRVVVNRFWQQFFGTGLVKTSEDFGSQGEPPSHPVLLDWLAVDFRQNGWDTKLLMKAIVMSDAYRRSAHVDAKQLRIDPANRLLARGPRFRLDAEVLRDQALALSGLLVDEMGGPSVKPPQPAGLWEAVGYTRSDTAVFVADEGEKTHRRSVYTFWKRTSPPPQMTTFDAPSRESCTARRERTNTPLQALLLMNEKQYVEAAKQIAKRVTELTDVPTTQSRIQWAFENVTGRPPSEQEINELESLLHDLVVHYVQKPELAMQLTGDSSPELAAWSIVASTLLNLDEVVNK
ncbi:Planctomycete cytochrome C [Planctomycetes bacterium CA13]|uniref:Planctomycete cytochrome C n=1 Tax=Novipirellula herctigrandis TaxID=2527986 RepID=A0A5C5YY66_9BACT|nr:Planctomycete cytochrome C [Planctomycetes bacterium CA13]